MRGQRVEDGVQPAFHHHVQLMQRQADAVIGDAVLREVVGADLLAAVAGAHHAAALRAERRLLLLQFDFVQPGTQHALGFGAILDLRFFVLAGDDQPRGQVRDAHRRIRRVDRLPARTGRAERIDADVLGIQLHFHFVGFGQHRHRDRRSVHAALLFGHRHALHAVHAALVFQLAVTLVRR